MKNLSPRLMAVMIATIALSACESGVGGNTLSAGPSGSGAARSEVEIIDGDTFTATWQQSSAATIRLTYDSTVPLSDVRAMEIAQLITSCTPTGAASQPAVIGGLTSVRIEANCTSLPDGTTT